MKKFTLAAALLGASAVMLAAPVTPDAALQRALGDAPRKVAGAPSAFKLVKTEMASETPALYLFANEKSHAFIVTPADDCAPSLLGYGTNPLTDAEGNYAPGFQYWISQLARQVEYASTAEGMRLIPMKARPERAPIEPLCKTLWNQSEPYNNLCPKISGERAVTGCVATAMAQAMKYFNWPERGTGKMFNSVAGRSQDFSKIQFDWANMLDTYYGVESTKEQQKAVAQLMMCCGYSVNMGYSLSGSGAVSSDIPGALGNFFFYDKSMQYLLRDNYSLLDWEDMIYANLSTTGPVIYDGQSIDGGHSFICDGYDKDGYFHFNWGWGGMSDGFFLLDALDPIHQGIGGASAGFDYMQDVILGIKPDYNGDSQPNNSTIIYSSAPEITYVSDADGNYILVQTVSEYSPIYNSGPFTISDGKLGMEFTKVDDPTATSLYSMVEIGEDLPVRYGFSRFGLPLPEGITDGQYSMHLVFQIGDGEIRPVLGPIYEANTWILTLSQIPDECEVQEVAKILPDMEDIRMPETAIIGENFEMSCKFVNTVDTPYMNFLYALVLDDKMENVAALSFPAIFDLEGNGTMEMNFSQPFVQGNVSEGTHPVAMAVVVGGYYGLYNEPTEVTFTKTVGVESIANEAEGEVEAYYTISGTYAGRDFNQLPAGLYIAKTSTGARKIAKR